MHRDLIREAFARHHGFEVDMQGDAFFVTFASASDAAAAAADAQRALASHDWPDENEIRVRMGLHTGEPRLIGDRYVGIDVHHGARVMAAGHGGQVLLSESTRALLDDRVRLRDLGEHRLKDLTGPQHLYQLEIEGLPAEFPPLNTLDSRPTNLPALPSAFIGRARELAEVEELLSREDLRLLTLTGTGGAGKTRLALQVAAEAIERFQNGVFFVSLSPVRDWELVVPTIAQTLGLREYPGETMLETLEGYVSDKELLLLLDNLEHVVAAAPAISGLLLSAPGLRVLATSRTPLHLSGRAHLCRPAPGLPNGNGAALEESEAVRLFIERAHAAAADFELTDDNAEAVAEICVRLDGLPLAIELAAPRVRALTPTALLRRLDQRLKLLTGGAQDLDERQRTLRATIEWSHDLLLEDEKVLFARLESFVGGYRLEAAEALCDPDGSLGTEVIDGLGSLVEKSLLRRRTDSDGEPRFWMLETIREYALELLEASGEANEARRLHACWYADEAERLDIESRTGDQPSVFARLDDDNANLRAAIRFARETRDGDLMLRLVTTLWSFFWSTRGYVAEGRRALEEAFELSDRRPARALLGLCMLRLLSGSSDGLLEDAEETRRACEELGDDFSLAQAWNLLGRVHGSVMGAIGPAEESWRQALSYAERGNYGAERAESISWLMVGAVFGPLPVEKGIARCKEFLNRGRRPDHSSLLLRRAGGPRSDGRRIPAGPRAARRGCAGDRRARTHRVGGRHRAGGVLRRDAGRERREGGGDPARQLRNARADGRAQLSVDDRRLPCPGALHARRVRRSGEPKPGERGRRRGQRRGLSGPAAARERRSRPGAARSRRPTRWPVRLSGSPRRPICSTPRETRCPTWPRPCRSENAGTRRPRRSSRRPPSTSRKGTACRSIGRERRRSRLAARPGWP